MLREDGRKQFTSVFGGFISLLVGCLVIVRIVQKAYSVSEQENARYSEYTIEDSLDDSHTYNFNETELVVGFFAHLLRFPGEMICYSEIWMFLV